MVSVAFSVKLWHGSCMTLPIANTHRVISKLQQHGFSEEQAVGITEALEEVDVSALATKLDLRDLKISLIQWMVTLMVALLAALVAIVQLIN